MQEEDFNLEKDSKKILEFLKAYDSAFSNNKKTSLAENVEFAVNLYKENINNTSIILPCSIVAREALDTFRKNIKDESFKERYKKIISDYFLKINGFTLEKFLTYKEDFFNQDAMFEMIKKEFQDIEEDTLKNISHQLIKTLYNNIISEIKKVKTKITNEIERVLSLSEDKENDDYEEADFSKIEKKIFRSHQVYEFIKLYNQKKDKEKSVFNNFSKLLVNLNDIVHNRSEVNLWIDYNNFKKQFNDFLFLLTNFSIDINLIDQNLDNEESIKW